MQNFRAHTIVRFRDRRISQRLLRSRGRFYDWNMRCSRRGRTRVGAANKNQSQKRKLSAVSFTV